MINAAKVFDESYPITGTSYSKRLLELISDIREYEYDLCVGQWSADYPAIFRAHHPLRISNQRHQLVDCQTIDRDPLSDDLRVISGWGTDLGVDFQGNYGVVSNRSRFGQYFHPDLDENGQPKVIKRQYIGNCPELGNV